MPALPATSVGEHFETLTDPRRDRREAHRLLDIVGITLCAVSCGADGWVDVATFGRVKAPWLRTFLALPGGIPSRDTFGRVLALPDREEVRRCFLSWAQAVVGAPGDQVVAIDGKALRRSHDRRAGKGAPHPVSAWASLKRVVRIESTRRTGDAVSTEARHSRSSLPAVAKALGAAIRSHWGIENRLHWALDVVFRADDCRVRVGHAPENLAIIRHVALNLLRTGPSRRASLATKRRCAALDDTSLRAVLNGLSA